MSSNSSRIEFQHTLNSSNFSCANTSNRKPNVFIQSSSNSGECLTGANKQVSLPDALYNCRDPNERPKSSHHSHRQSLQSSQKQQAPNSLSLEENNAMNPISIDDSDDQTFSNASAASDLQQLNIDELDDEPNDNRDSDYVSTLKNKPPRKQRSDLSSCAGSSARGRGKTGRKRAAAKETSVNVISFYDKPSSQQLSYTTTLFEYECLLSAYLLSPYMFLLVKVILLDLLVCLTKVLSTCVQRRSTTARTHFAFYLLPSSRSDWPWPLSWRVERQQNQGSAAKGLADQRRPSPAAPLTAAEGFTK